MSNLIDDLTSQVAQTQADDFNQKEDAKQLKKILENIDTMSKSGLYELDWFVAIRPNVKTALINKNFKIKTGNQNDGVEFIIQWTA